MGDGIAGSLAKGLLQDKTKKYNKYPKVSIPTNHKSLSRAHLAQRKLQSPNLKSRLSTWQASCQKVLHLCGTRHQGQGTNQSRNQLKKVKTNWVTFKKDNYPFNLPIKIKRKPKGGSKTPPGIGGNSHILGGAICMTRRNVELHLAPSVLSDC